MVLYKFIIIITVVVVVIAVTALQHFVWLVQLPGTVSHWTFVQHLYYHFQKHAQDTSFTTFLLHWMFPEYKQRILYSALLVTLAMLLCLINFHLLLLFVIILWCNSPIMPWIQPMSIYQSTG